MWNIIIVVCAVGIVGTIIYSAYYVRKKEFDLKTTMKAIALSAAAVLAFTIPVVARVTYTTMSADVEKKKIEVEERLAEVERRLAEAGEESRKIVQNADKTAATIKAEAKEEKLRLDARLEDVRDSIKTAKKRLKEEKRKEEKERRKLEKISEINKRQLTIQNRQKTIEKQVIEMDTLERNIERLKHTALSVSEFQHIAEMALLRTNIKWTRVYRDPVSDTQKGSIWPSNDYVSDEIFMVYTKNLNGAKFGFDLNEVMIAKQGKNYVISDISAKYIGAEKQKVTDDLAEYRRTGYKKGGLENTVEIKKDKMSLQRVDDIRKKYTEIISETGVDGVEEITYLKDAVVVQAQNYLKVILAPLCKDNGDCIRFTDKTPDKSYKLMEYLKNELYANEEKFKELSSSVEQTKSQIKIDKAEQSELMESLERAGEETDEDENEVTEESEDW